MYIDVVKGYSGGWPRTIGVSTADELCGERFLKLRSPGEANISRDPARRALDLSSLDIRQSLLLIGACVDLA